jgi:hypothetical protein
MSSGSKVPPDFHKRFNIPIDLDDARTRFINRVVNTLEVYAPQVEFVSLDHSTLSHDTERRAIAKELGKKYEREFCFSDYVEDDFFTCLRALEALYKKQPQLTQLVLEDVMPLSEVDLGISWKDGVFWPSGAKLLDEALVNEPLQWLSDPKYHNVLVPFEKGLRDFLEANKYPERLADTVTDMYEALEAMAKVVTGRPRRDLSSNAELFVSKLDLSAYYKKMLKDYISYASEFRHALEEGEKRVPPQPQEVEALIYTTGLFIRLAIERINAQTQAGVSGI